MVDYRLPPLRPGLSTSPSTYSHSRPYSHERDRGSTASADLDSNAALSPAASASTPKSESRPMSAVLAALANEDVEYTGIVRPLRDGTYDRSDRYLPPLERLASASAGPSRLSDYGPLTTHGWEENYRSVQPGVRRGSDASDTKPRHFAEGSSNGSAPAGAGAGAGAGKDAPGPSRDNTSNGSRKDGAANESKDAARPAPTSPEATQKKKKRKVNPAKPMEHIPEGAEVEYEQDGDPMRGPVFVHPPKDSVQACVRCHRIKRKCDGARPRCSACTKADVPCVFELSPATST